MARTISSLAVLWTIFGIELNLLRLLLSFILLNGDLALAYIPASPVNGSVAPPDASGSNGSLASFLNLQWFGGGYQERISYQLVGAESNGVSKGALVHFSEDHLNNDTTTTPWIALVSCDANATDASQVDDIFTLANERGAVAALLYSLYSDRCEINPEYADPASFDQLMDIFSTPSLASSQFIEYQYSAINETKYGHYDANLLNQTAAQINETIQNGTVDSKGFMFATLVAFNATTGGDAGADGTNGVTTDGDGGSGNGKPNTSLAMIILYAITGCVSALFCIVIVSGAIRAIRHPERYGPRGGDGFDGPPGSQSGPQSRARGLTRAILDTFPVVKFGGSQNGGYGAGTGTVGEHMKDLESTGSTDSVATTRTGGREALKMRELDGAATGETEDKAEVEVVEDVNAKRQSGERHSRIDTTPRALSQPGASSSQLPPSSYGDNDTHTPSRRSASANNPPNPSDDKDIVPDSIGRETCPICIVDFEEGDDLRVLPCEGHHMFHQACVDPWLLELSSSCPICRQDFHTLETMMAHDSNEHLEPPPPIGGGTGGLSIGGSATRPLSGAGARLSRYLRLARRRRHQNQSQEAIDERYASDGAAEPHRAAPAPNAPIVASL